MLSALSHPRNKGRGFPRKNMKSFILALALTAGSAGAMAENYVRIPTPGIHGAAGTTHPAVPQLPTAPVGGGNSAGLVLSTASLMFEDILNKTTSAAKVVTVKNMGTSTTPLSVGVSGEYKEAPGTTCGTSLAPGAQCEVGVAFSPAAAGRDIAGELAFQSSYGEARVALIGSSYLAASSVIAVQPFSLEFTGETLVGLGTGSYLSVDIVGTSPVTFGTVSFSGQDAAEYSASVGGLKMCRGVVAAGTTCRVSVRFNAKTVGTTPRTAVINLPNNGTDIYGQAGLQSTTVRYAGSVIASAGLVSDFGSVLSPSTFTHPLGTAIHHSMYFQNSGNIDVHTSGVTVAGMPVTESDLKITNECSTITPNTNCLVRFETSSLPVGVHNIVITLGADALYGPAKAYIRFTITP